MPCSANRDDSLGIDYTLCQHQFMSMDAAEYFQYVQGTVLETNYLTA